MKFDIKDRDSSFCSWFALNYPEQYKFYRDIWMNNKVKVK